MSKLTLEIPADTPLMDIARMAASIGCRVEAQADQTFRLVPERGCKVVPLHEQGRRRMAERMGRHQEPEQPA